LNGESISEKSTCDGYNMKAIQQKTGILFVAFGTSMPKARAALDNVEVIAEKRYPGAEIRWAYTSVVIRRKLAKQGIELDSPVMALAKMREEGFTHVAVQSLHVVAGAEYHDLARTVVKVASAPDSFEKITLGKPLLMRRDDADRVVKAIIENLPPRQDGDAVVLMGHGNENGLGEMAFVAMAARLQKADRLAFLGTIEGVPTRDDMLAQLQEAKPKRAFLVPLMLVAGTHAGNDLTGSGKDSWASQIGQLGIECVPVLQGLGENPGVAAVWLDHLETALKNSDS